MTLYGYGKWLANKVNNDKIAESTACLYYNVAVDLHQRQKVEPDDTPLPSHIRGFAQDLENDESINYRNIYNRFVALRYYYKYNGQLHLYEGVLHDLKQEYYVEPP